MRTTLVILLLSGMAYGQKFNGPATGTMDAHGLTYIPPTATFASPPASPPTGAWYVFTDASSLGTCSGGGSAKATCQWTGSIWTATGGGGGGGTTPSFDVNGTLVGTRNTLNLINGTNVTMTGVDNSGAGRVDITVNSSGGGGSTGGGVPFISTLKAGPDTTGTITGATHQFTTVGLIVFALDNSSPQNSIQLAWTVNASTFDVAYTFNTPQSNYYIVIMSGAGGNSLPPYTCAVGGVSSIACTHSLGTTTPAVWCYDNSGNLLGGTGSAGNVTSIVATSSNVATLTFSATITGTCIISTGSSGAGGSTITNPLSAGGGTGYLASGGLPCNKGSVSLSGGTFTWNGNTVAAAAATSQEFTIVTGLNGNLRFDHAMVSENTIFASGTVTSLSVSLGRPGGSTDDELLAQTALMVSSGNAWFAYERPQPPILGSSNTYTLVLTLRSGGGNISALTTGQVNYEVCGWLSQ